MSPPSLPVKSGSRNSGELPWGISRPCFRGTARICATAAGSRRNTPTIAIPDGRLMWINRLYLRSNYKTPACIYGRKMRWGKELALTPLPSPFRAHDGSKKAGRAMAQAFPKSTITPRKPTASTKMRDQRKTLFDAAIINNPQAAIDFITNILESSTEYSVIAKDLDGKILLWNEGARRLYGYEPEEVVGKMNSSPLHALEDVKAGLPKKIMMDALEQGKFEGTVSR